MSLDFDKAFDPRHGEAVTVAPGVQRVTADNSGPFTFHGTNSYIVGEKSVAVIDPGPEDANHLDALRRAIAGRPISHILVSHTHRDHAPLAHILKEETGAPIFAEGQHRAARDLHIGEVNPLDASADHSFAPDYILDDGAQIVGEDWTLEAVTTPGHTANHLAFAMPDEALLFSADHVMAWATTIVAPPDGSMSDFMASLSKLMGRTETLYLPGHGGPVREPAQFLRGLRGHRKMRERAILARLETGQQTVSDIVEANYRDIDPRLHGAAGLSTLAHLEDLVARGRAETDGRVAIDAVYRIADPSKV